VSEPVVRLGIRVRAGRAETALADLLPLLAAGAEERPVDGDVEYSLYAPAGELPRPEEIRALAGDAVVGITTEPVDSGWDRRWHEFLRPVRVGPLVVRPPWIAGSPGDLVIDPGTCFGAGTHPTTRLCLRLLLDAAANRGAAATGASAPKRSSDTAPASAAAPPGGLCDWGAGTGVLAIAAARLGFAPVTAVENDPAAVAATRANAAANGVAVTVAARDLAAGAPWAPTVVANLPLDVHRAAAAALERPPQRLLASGFLREQAGAVAAAYGLPERIRIHDGEWAALALGEPAA
jgi:ribosomal protein L11 methyltransferase